MSFDPLLKIEIKVDFDNPNVLEGLDAWLKLGLISPEEMTIFCQKSLSCRLPEIPKVTPVIPQNENKKNSNLQSISAPKNISPKAPNFITESLQPIVAELSVVWLLFLGLFLVIISSAVLAARQWENFSSVAQYGVLFFYTLTFFGMSLWTRKNPHLHLTTQTLELISLLLIPVNFWAIDSFEFPHLIIRLIPAIFLIGMTQHLWRSTNLSLFQLINYLILSFCQWGWKIQPFPSMMIYCGVILTFFQNVYLPYHQNFTSSFIRIQTSPKADLFIIYGLFILLIRGTLIEFIPLSQFGLALAITGIVLLCFKSNFFWEKIIKRDTLSLSLFGLGWGVSVSQYPLQALGVTGLALVFLMDRLHKFWRISDLFFLEALGLQSFWLMWRLIPINIQENILSFAITKTNAESFPLSLFGVVLFPYILFLIILNHSLEKKQQNALVQVSEGLTLMGGTILTLLSSINPLLRTINLCFSTLIIGWFTHQKINLYLNKIIQKSDPSLPSQQTLISSLQVSHLQPLIYLTHFLSLLTLYSGIYYIFPHLSLSKWIVIHLSLMAIQWGIFTLTQSSHFQENFYLQLFKKSNFHFGLILGIISLFFLKLTPTLFPFSLLGFLIPFSLLILGIFTQKNDRQFSIHLSVILLIIINLFIVNTPKFYLINFSISAILMLVNTRLVIQTYMAMITLGFIILWEVKYIDQTLFTLKHSSLSLETLLLTSSLTILGLYVLKNRIGQLFPQSQSDYLSQKIYTQASNIWGIFLTIIVLLLITLHSSILYHPVSFITFQPSPLISVTIIILITAITYRNYPTFSSWEIYTIAWGLELLTAETLALIHPSNLVLSVANILLGWIIQWLGNYTEKSRIKRNLPPLPSLKIIPLIYGGIGLILRSQTTTHWTGLITLGISIILINFGRNNPTLKSILYLGLLGISLSLYEITIYQLIHHSSGGSWGDGFVILAGLGTGILYTYQILLPWLVHFLNTTIEDLKKICHFHWFLSSFFLVFAGLSPLNSGLFIGLGIGLILIQYAIFMGRYHPVLFQGELWVYLGFIEAFAIRIYWINSPVAQVLNGPLFSWKIAIASLFGLILSLLPWENWGWSKRPWNFLTVTVPIIAILECRGEFHPFSLLFTAGFYVFISRKYQQIRWTYMSLFLINWLWFRWLQTLQTLHPQWLIFIPAISWLYLVQVEPIWRDKKDTRHHFRFLGILLWGGVLLFYQEGLITAFLSLLILVLGMAQKIRAFVYGGTVIFMLNTLYQLLILSLEYPFLKAVIGLGFGVIFIVIAGNFETRQTLMVKTVKNWLAQLASWE